MWAAFPQKRICAAPSLPSPATGLSVGGLSVRTAAAGSGIMRPTISGKMSGCEKNEIFTAALRRKNAASSAKKHSLAQAGKAPDIPVAEITAASRSVDLELIGCPMLTVGSMYFIDFYTGTDVDNFYICKKVSHQIAGHSFKTSASFNLWMSGARITIPGDVDGFERMMSENSATE